jgi:hypothetical protein
MAKEYTTEDLNVRLHVTLGACVTAGLYAGPVTRESVAQHLANLFTDASAIEDFIERIEIAELVTDDEDVLVAGDTSPAFKK